MTLINEILYYMNMFGICLIVSAVLVCGALLYFVKIRKVVARTENIDTSSFQKKDSTSYVPIRDILYDDTLDSDGIIAITDTLFVAGLSVRGFDYASASTAERVDAQVNSTAFFNVVDGFTSFRQSVSSIDLSSGISEYESVIKKVATELMELDADYNDTIASAAQAAEEDPESYSYFEKRLQELQRKISAKNHVLDECRSCVGYMQALSKDSGKYSTAGGQRTSQVMFSFTFNPDLYSQELTREEIYLKAREALHAKARSYADAFAFCHFRARRLSCRELVGLIRRHNFPISGEDGTLEELLDSSYTSLFLSSDSIVEAQKERIGEEEFEKHLKEYEEELAAMLERQKEEMAAAAGQIYDETAREAEREMKGGESQ